jgi:uncharacterized protein (DUF1015 family)
VAVVESFRAARYDERRAGPLASLVAPPYDVISSVERAELLASSPYNVVHLLLPDSPEQAAKLLGEWWNEGVLVREDEPALWWMRQEYEAPDGSHHVRLGFIGLVKLEPYETGAIRPHERTYPAVKAAQLKILREVRTSLSPLWFLYDDAEDVPRQVLEPFATGEPVMEGKGQISSTKLWRVTDREAIARASGVMARLPLMIADGHHRYETALQLHEEDGTARSAYTMAALVNARAGGVSIFPTHRVVREVPELNGRFDVTPVSGGAHEAIEALQRVTHAHPAFVLYRPGKTAVVEVPDGHGTDAAAVDRLGLAEVSYTPRLDEAVGLVDSGQAAAALLVRAPSLEQVQEVVEAGETMPQKSTYFYPKLISGLLFNPF